MGAYALDLDAIEAALLEVQQRYASLDTRAPAVRDPMDRIVIDNLLAGYRHVGQLVADDVDLLAMGQHRHLLELNSIVLCGTDPARRDEYRRHLSATETRFYDEPDAGIVDLLEWCQVHARDDVRNRAAGAAVQILAKPQLFIEGNQRTTALFVSYLLLRAGRPPFVLNADTAGPYFACVASIRDVHRHSLGALMRLPALRRKLAALIDRQASNRYVLPRRPAPPADQPAAARPAIP